MVTVAVANGAAAVTLTLAESGLGLCARGGSIANDVTEIVRHPMDRAEQLEFRHRRDTRTFPLTPRCAMNGPTTRQKSTATLPTRDMPEHH